MALNIVSRNVLRTQDTRTFTCPISEQKHGCPRDITRGHLRTCPDMSRTRHLRVLFEKNRTCPKRTFPSKHGKLCFNACHSWKLANLGGLKNQYLIPSRDQYLIHEVSGCDGKDFAPYDESIIPVSVLTENFSYYIEGFNQELL
jgi:hypothetical protein